MSLELSLRLAWCPNHRGPQELSGLQVASLGPWSVIGVMEAVLAAFGPMVSYVAACGVRRSVGSGRKRSERSAAARRGLAPSAWVPASRGASSWK